MFGVKVFAGWVDGTGRITGGYRQKGTKGRGQLRNR